MGAWAPARAPRRVRSTLSSWPLAAAETLAELDALIIGVTLDRPEPPAPDDLGRLGPGAMIVELAVPALRPIRALLGLDRRPLQRAAAGQARVLAWLGRDYYGLEQWESVDPSGVIVTLARRGPGGSP